MMAMIERVEDAIADTLVISEGGGANYREVAIAVLRALRDPTREMFVAAFEALVPASDANACWRAMIDAALNEVPV